MKKIMVIFGTRPEAIKMAPVIKELIRRKADLIIVSTGQHREMLGQVLKIFDIKPDVDLDVMEPNQTLSNTGGMIFAHLNQVIKHYRPDYVLVQGDTLTAFFGALAAFYQKIPVGHIEAGLRTYKKDPYPEEAHRRMITSLATHHFAPTEEAKVNLLYEGVEEERIFVTGNTGIDAFLEVAGRIPISQQTKKDTILVTAHRRENFQYMESICYNILDIINSLDVFVIFPVHPNPNVREVVCRILEGNHKIILMPPLDYNDLVKVMHSVKLVVTDSGGLQEEAPALGKPVIVIRESTERKEGIKAGVACLAHPTAFAGTVKWLLTHEEDYQNMAKAINPYGDGHAAEKIVEGVLEFLKEG